jgi:membrane associated rhomboid family serine protease
MEVTEKSFKRIRPRLFIKAGILFAVLMWIAIIGIPFAIGVARGSTLQWEQLTIGAFLCALGGALYAILMNWFLSRRPR